jgi:hypothetical protein
MIENLASPPPGIGLGGVEGVPVPPPPKTWGAAELFLRVARSQHTGWLDIYIYKYWRTGGKFVILVLKKGDGEGFFVVVWGGPGGPGGFFLTPILHHTQ